MESKVKVSVCISTYNQQDTIKQCIVSALHQVTDYNFEVIVGDDCSSDETASILKELALEYPGRLKLLLSETNKGPSENYLAIHQSAKGEYICHLDGDDYCLPGKLEAQALYLDNNEDVNLVWHRMGVLSSSTGDINPDKLDKEMCYRKYSQADLIKYITIGLHSSVMYRSGYRFKHPPQFPVLDYLANVEIISNGYAAFCNDEIYGVYRAGIGIASSGGITKRLLGQTFEYLFKKHPEYKRELSSALLLVLAVSLKNGNYRDILFLLRSNYKILHFLSIYDLIQSRKFISALKLPSNSK